MSRRSLTGICLTIALICGFNAKATQYAYRVNFTDKNNTPYSLSSPLAYLSSRAIARRSEQGITVDSTDLPVNSAYIDSVLTLTGGILHESSRWLNMCVILISDSTQIHTLDGKAFISSTKLVAYYPGILHNKPAAHVASGTNANNIASLINKPTSSDAAYYNTTWLQTTIVNGNYLHDDSYKGAGKLIAVLDAGFISVDTHPGFDSLRNDGRLLDVHNFTLDTTYVYAYDDHGTKVLSTMAGYVPDTFVGSAPLASYALYVTEDDNSEQPIELINLLCGAERADSLGADIISESLGYDLFDNPADGQVFTDLDGKTTVGAQAANIATKKGILFVATAGNDGTGVPGWGNHILTPGDADSALTIGSVDATGTIAATSGYGPNAAGQIKPDVVGMGQSASIFTVPTGYGAEDGTSFSTPEIAGWAACLWEAIPSATPYQLKQAIIKCASTYSAPGIQMGYGIPNFQCTQQLLGVQDLHPFNVGTWVTATPNPFEDILSLLVAPDTDQYVDIRIMDITGKIFLHTHDYYHKGPNQPVSISLLNLPSGIYILHAVSPSHQQVIKLEKL